MTDPQFTNPNDYQAQASRTLCDQEKALRKINFHSKTAVTLLHGVLGLMGEVGELAANLERWLWYGQPFNRANFKEELGDAQWYQAELHNAIDIEMLQTMRSNIAKLRARYPEKFDEELAKEENRDREKEAGEARRVEYSMSMREVEPGDFPEMDREEPKPEDSFSLSLRGYTAEEVNDLIRQALARGWTFEKQDPSATYPTPGYLTHPTVRAKAARWIKFSWSFDGGDFIYLPHWLDREILLPTLEQNGHGWAEPPIEDSSELVQHKLSPPYLYGKSRNHPPGEEKKPFFVTKEEIDKCLKDADSFALSDPPGFVERKVPGWALANPSKGKGKPEFSSENPFDVAREIAQSYAEGQNLKYALQTVANREAGYNLGAMQRLALTGKMAIEALGLDPENTSPAEVYDRAKELLEFEESRLSDDLPGEDN